MNLKNIHLVFIAVVTLMCGFFVFWGLQRQDPLGVVFTILGITGGLGLALYGRKFAIKMNKLKAMASTLAVFGLIYGSEAIACSTCFSGGGEGSASQLNGLRWSVVFLLGIVFCILSAFGGFVMFLIRSEKKGAL